MYYTAYYDSPLGRIRLAEKDGKLAGLWFVGQKYDLGSLGPEELTEREDSALMNRTRTWLEHYFRGEKPSVQELDLAPEGSAYRKEVWELLLGIPYGEVTTYGALAGRIAARRGLSRIPAQAVGGAVAHNPISVIIPCHRVVGSDGSLTGYAGGLDRKKALLTLEGVKIEERKMRVCTGI